MHNITTQYTHNVAANIYRSKIQESRIQKSHALYTHIYAYGSKHVYNQQRSYTIYYCIMFISIYCIHTMYTSVGYYNNMLV